MRPSQVLGMNFPNQCVIRNDLGSPSIVASRQAAAAQAAWHRCDFWRPRMGLTRLEINRRTALLTSAAIAANVINPMRAFAQETPRKGGVFMASLSTGGS